MAMRYAIVTVVLALVALGCHHKDPAAEDNTTPHLVPDTGDPTDNSGNMQSADKEDQVRVELRRKGMIVSHCLATAMENKEVSRGARGKIVLEIVIAGTKASSVHIVKSDIDAKSVQDCVVKHVQSIGFPDMGAHYETSYTYAMEAN